MQLSGSSRPALCVSYVFGFLPIEGAVNKNPSWGAHLLHIIISGDI